MKPSRFNTIPWSRKYSNYKDLADTLLSISKEATETVSKV